MVVAYRQRADDAQAVVAGICEAGGSAEALQLDITDPEHRAAVTPLISRLGQLHILVNNAGILADAWYLLADSAALDEVLQTNVTGAFALTREVARHMAAKRTGAIVNVASIAGIAASPGQSIYAASKGAILAWTRTIAHELAPKGVRVNAVVPGLFDAGMGKRLDRRARRDREQQIPLGRAGTADELAAVVAFLASDDASYVIGQALVVDGGLVP